jgi:glutamyl-tRNA(Gln) amidotransferase subunit E
MSKRWSPRVNYEESRKAIGYIDRKKATQADYDHIGFMSGLEVHQQLDTKHKLFCKCPVGKLQKPDDFDAEIVRHMRPTMSELGEYDGTALMEFKTRKNITYRLKKESACTYEVDDTPPFPINKDALEIAIRISMLSKLNIVGEVHITRKQYLDGSIPAGFQRTAIVGVNGQIELPHKSIGLIQLSIEEDACREVSDIGHERIYRTDRLGTPLIETVTEPDFVNPDEVREGCDYIRFLNRSTGMVRTGPGAGRQDVNVSCKGGTRVEIKGVSHTKWIPQLTHNEAFRQWALLHIRSILTTRVKDYKNWKIKTYKLSKSDLRGNTNMKDVFDNNHQVLLVKLPHFYRILSHFTQPGKIFADEISERLKVIACLDQPNMTHSEELNPILTEEEAMRFFKKMKAGKDDAFILFDAPQDDVDTALQTIEERCKMAFEGVPEETRKSFADGTTIFERVLPGADRMYPDTDSAPIPLTEEYIENLRKELPEDIIKRYRQMKKWKIAEHTYTYILSKNLYPIIKEIIHTHDIKPAYIGKFFGQILKYQEGQKKLKDKFNYKILLKLFDFLKNEKIEYELAERMLPVLLEHPLMQFDSIVTEIGFKRIGEEEIAEKIEFLKKKFTLLKGKDKKKAKTDWLMGELRYIAVGNIPLESLYKKVIS